jgi:hypothetical protein
MDVNPKDKRIELFFPGNDTEPESLWVKRNAEEKYQPICRRYR